MKGFTLIELLVVIGISAMLAGIAVTYTNIAKNQVALSVEASKIGGALFRAKDLAVATYNTPPGPGGTKTCGYGVIVNRAANTYSIFAFTPDQGKPQYSGTNFVDLTKFCPSLSAVQAAGLTLSSNCGATAEVASTSEATWDVPVANSIKLAQGGADLSVALFYPPDPDVLLSTGDVTKCSVNFLSSPQTLSALLTSPDGKASTSVVINPAGQITF